MQNLIELSKSIEYLSHDPSFQKHMGDRRQQYFQHYNEKLERFSSIVADEFIMNAKLVGDRDLHVTLLSSYISHSARLHKMTLLGYFETIEF